MIKGTHTLLDKKLDKQRSFEDHMKSLWERGQVPCGPTNLVSNHGANIEVPHKSKKKQRRTSAKSKLAMPPPPKVLELSTTPHVKRHVESLVEPMEMVPNSVSKYVGNKWMKDL